ncbi:50S ribosomal protein L21 [Halothermothrix orenii]|nr:50S ribosomal protein L21 [Halothermothrix orenii]
MYAIIKTGGKQYRVEEGKIIKVEKLPVAEGEQVEFDKVLAYADDEGVKFGQPYVEGVRVTGKVIENGKNKKIIVFKYKAKNRYRRKTGHRQPYSRVLIEKIEA